MMTTAQTLAVARGPHRMYAEVTPGDGLPVVLMHGFPDNTHLYDRLVPELAARVAAQPAFWRLNNDLLGAVLTRRRRVPQLRRFTRPVRVIFGARDRYFNARVARRFATVFPHSELHLLPEAGHHVQVDEPQRVAALITE